MKLKSMGVFYTLWILFAYALAAIGAEKKQEDLILEAFRGLGARSADEVIEKNLAIIKARGVASLWVLVEQLDNKEIAHSSFESMDSVVIDQKSGLPTGDMMKLTLGEVAFDLVQEMIEGFMPFMYREYLVLNPKNAKEWILSRKEKSLDELQVEAAELTLNNALELERKDQSDFSKALVKFCKLRFERARGHVNGVRKSAGINRLETEDESAGGSAEVSPK